MNNSTISFTIHDDDAFVGLKSFTEHHFIAKRKSCLFDLSLIVCNDAKIQKNRLFNTRKTSETLQRERAKQWESKRDKGIKALLSRSQWMWCVKLFLYELCIKFSRCPITSAAVLLFNLTPDNLHTLFYSLTPGDFLFLLFSLCLLELEDENRFKRW